MTVPSLSAEQGTEIAGIIIPVLILAAVLRIMVKFIEGFTTSRKE